MDSCNGLVIVAFGNANVDVIAKANGQDIVEKFGINISQEKCEVSKELHKKLLEYLNANNLVIKKSAGGCAQNTMRTFQKLNGVAFRSAIIGKVGMDSNAAFLKDQLSKDGILTLYSIDDINDTSCVIVLLINDISLAVAYTGAAKFYTLDMLNPKLVAIISSAKYIFLEGFFTLHSPEIGKKCVEICREKGQILVYNICAEYAINTGENSVYFCKVADIVVGNRKEFQALLKKIVVNADDSNYHDQLKNVYDKLTDGQRKKQVLIITDGEFPVMCVHEGGKIMEVSVPHVNRSEIVDTTGAGDAFIGGFLYAHSTRKSLRECIETGIQSSNEVIKRLGA